MNWGDSAILGSAVACAVGGASILLGYFYRDTTREQKVYCGLVTLAWVAIVVTIHYLV
jgi:hypothetical protein